MSTFAFAHARPESFQVPAVHCDAHGYIKPLGAENRFQYEFAKDCRGRLFDPDEALAVPRPRTHVEPPPREVVECALAPVWSRVRGSCIDPRAFDKFKSEWYPLPADVVRDTRPPLKQIGHQSRFDARDPIKMYQRLRGDDWVTEGQNRVVRAPGFY